MSRSLPKDAGPNPLIAELQRAIATGDERFRKPLTQFLLWIGEHQQKIEGALVAFRLLEEVEQERRRAGGRSTGAQEQRRAAELWTGCRTRYDELTKELKPAQARQKLAAEFKLNYHDDYIRRMLREPRVPRTAIKKSRKSA